VSQYAKLDKSILWVLASAGPCSFTELQSGALWAECRHIAESAGTTRSPFGTSPAHVLGRRLQALRKAGKIEYLGAKVTEGWAIRGDQQ